MAVALATTKWPMLADQGFWYMAHESGTDWSMTLGSLYLLIVGAKANVRRASTRVQIYAVSGER
jgi:hypothetical protein